MAFLKKNSFIFKNNSDLPGAVFVEKALSSKEHQKTVLAHLYKGMFPMRSENRTRCCAKSEGAGKNMAHFQPNRIIKKLYRMLIFDVWSVSSKLCPNENIRVIFMGKGNEIDKRYFQKLIFNESYNENYLGKACIWRLIYYFWKFKKSHDLLILKTEMKICNLLKSKNRFVVPDWISCEIDICGDLSSRSISKRTFKSNLKKIQQGNFNCSITNNPADFDNFYHNMYLPYLSNRHGDLGLEISEERMKRSFANGELLLIRDGQETIAGALIDYRIMNGIPRLVQVGILRGDFNFVKKGALTAVYYFTIEHLREKNYKKFSVGYARPFIYDGLTNYKLHWGANIVCETSKAFLICMLSQKKCLDTFLSSNPFICRDKDCLALMTFATDDSKEDKKFDKYREKLN